MADKLSDALNKLTEKHSDTFKEVVCPFCVAKIRLYAKMEYGYCRFCAGKVSLRDAQDRKFSRQLIDHLSGEEYYTLMQEGKENVDVNVAKEAVEKGSLTAAVELGRLYFGKGDYETAMHYFEIAKDGGNSIGKEMYPLAALALGSTYAAKEDYKKAIHYFEIAKNYGNSDAKVQYVLCKDVIEFGSGELTSSKCRKMLNEIAEFDQLTLLEPSREMLNNIRNILKKTIKDEERKEKERKQRLVIQREVELKKRMEEQAQRPQVPISCITERPVEYKPERSFTDGGPTGCGIGGSFCGCGAGR